ncbi:hypothetical protein CLU85_3532 [Acidovorax sp. 69]|nr:hypothetical protein CLU85_3532 [Acidovorax sp. 69]
MGGKQGNCMILRQKSVFDGFTYEFLDDTGTVVLGAFRHAWFSQAKNARLRIHATRDAAKGDIQMTLNGQAWRVRHLYLSRGYLNDIRYTLETGDEAIHAQVDVLGKTAGQRLPRIVMTEPISVELGTPRGWPKKRYAVTDSATRRPIGCIREPSAITLKRELLIEMPGVDLPVAAFLGIVALIARY